MQVGHQPFGWGPTDETEARAAVRKALDLGVNFFDTADVYGLGRSEEILGQELGRRAVFIATKGGNVRTTGGQNRKDFSKDYLFQAVERSLKRLQREAIDVFQLHNPSEEEIRRGEGLEVLEELRSAGKVRATGVSIHRPEEGLALLASRHPPDTVQLAYNWLNTGMAKHVLPLAMEEDVGIIARIPLHHGLLTGKFERDVVFREDDHRSWSLNPQTIERGCRLLESIAPQLREHQLSPAQLALKFVLSHPGISVTIPGARDPLQVEENVSASDGKPLPPHLIRAVSGAPR